MIHMTSMELSRIRCHFCQIYVPWQIVIVRVVIGIWNDWVCPDCSDNMDKRIAEGYGQGDMRQRKEKQ